MAEEEVMAEEAPAEEQSSPEKHVAYRLLVPLGNNKEGDCIYLPEEIGKKLMKQQVVEHAIADDMAGAEDEANEEELDETPVFNGANKIAKDIEKKTAERIAKQMRATVKPGAPVYAEVKSLPFRSNGDYVRTLAKMVAKGATSSDTNRVMAWQNLAAENYEKMGIKVKAPLGINETTNSQGGFLVNPQFSKDVFVIDHGQIDLAAMCEQVDAESNVFNQRYINETSLANGSIFGGLNLAATAEGASFSSSLPAWANNTFTLQKFAIFTYYTSEVLQDASYPIESELDEYANKAILYGINTQIVQGSTLEGLLNTPALVTVTSSSNDTAFHTASSTNLTYADLANIWAQVYSSAKTSPKGIWLMHPSLAASLVQMTYTFSGSNPAWGLQYDAQAGLVGGGSLTPYKIFGKPCYECWAASAPGLAGDILYVDMADCLHYKKALRVEVSKDYQFGSDQVAVRFVWRGDVHTRFRNKVTGPSGSQQFSSIVTRSAVGT